MLEHQELTKKNHRRSHQSSQNDGMEVGKHRLDLFIEDIIVVELKAIKNLDDIHFAIVRSYLRATGQMLGLLLNFAKITLEIKRVITS